MASVIFEQASRLWKDMRDDWENDVQYEYLAALEGTGGVLVNRKGRALHIDGLSLFTGPKDRAYKYASEELIEWWNHRPRMTLAEYEKTWFTMNVMVLHE